ncbi:hypothetical protein CPLU01_03029 [Colletotrichum plurivorum]|uniref:Uncharacterized protein n=1 Tax=Colletotrichum plurivorum TaxID=2175906 RepID=A0A8H6KUA4_9PEZI|nr:hypothetical protein CPLU01_03029 [Colletotrichum plurivorum]
MGAKVETLVSGGFANDSAGSSEGTTLYRNPGTLVGFGPRHCSDDWDPSPKQATPSPGRMRESAKISKKRLSERLPATAERLTQPDMA